MDKHKIKIEPIIFRLIFDKDQEEFVQDSLLPLVDEFIDGYDIFILDQMSPFDPDQPLLLYLSDRQLKELFPHLVSTNILLAVLPHPEAKQACQGMGIDQNLDKAINHIKNPPEPIHSDVSYCNDMPLFNNMVVGQTFKLSSENLSTSSGFWKRNFTSIARFFHIRPFRVEVGLPSDKIIKTSLTGVVVSEYKKSFLSSRLLLEDSSVNDGKMHAFLISPRSIVEMLGFAIRSLWKKDKLPPFGAYIKTTQIGLTFPEGPRDYLLDGEKFSSQHIALRVEKEQIYIIPGSLKDLGSSTDTGEIFKVKALPSGEAAQQLAGHSLPFISHATSDEFKELFQVLRDNARLKNSFLVLMVLSTVLATFGLFADSTPVVIGAMILAPLMAPIISLSMGTLRHDKKLITNSILTIIAGLGLSLLFAVFITLLTPLQTAGSEILARTRPNLLDLGIAVVSGIAGAYAHAREEVAKTLAGVAIAVALIPPLAVAGIGIGWADWEIFSGASLLLFTNLAGMVLTASFTFMLLGFSPFKLVQKGMVISFILVLLLGFPLALGFNQMVYEHQVKKQLEGIETDIAILKDVRVQGLSPMKISLKIVSEDAIENEEIDRIKFLIEEKISQKVEIEVVTAISR